MLALALSGFACRSERPSEPDAGVSVPSDPAGTPDAHTPDAGISDAGRLDHGAFDAGIRDDSPVFQPGPTGLDAGATDAGGATPPPEATLACIEYMRGQCERSARCQGSLASLDACMANARFCPDVMYAPGSSRTPEATRACADEWRDLACDAVPSRPECATAGTRAAGEPCISAMQCASLSCTAYGSSCGVCGDVVGEGEECDLDANVFCADGLTCTTDTPRVCVPLAGSSSARASAATPLGDECDPDTAQCAPNECRLDAENVYRCQAYPTLGQNCSETLTCAPGDSYCDVSQLCTAFPAVGSSCGVDAFTGLLQWCGPDASCVENDTGASVCQSLPGPGEACTTSCLQGRLCLCDEDNGCETRHCGRWRSPDESCEAAGDRCLAGACVAGSCRAAGEQGLFVSACGL